MAVEASRVKMRGFGSVLVCYGSHGQVWRVQDVIRRSGRGPGPGQIFTVVDLNTGKARTDLMLRRAGDSASTRDEAARQVPMTDVEGMKKLPTE